MFRYRLGVGLTHRQSVLRNARTLVTAANLTAVVGLGHRYIGMWTPLGILLCSVAQKVRQGHIQSDGGCRDGKALQDVRMTSIVEFSRSQIDYGIVFQYMY